MNRFVSELRKSSAPFDAFSFGPDCAAKLKMWLDKQPCVDCVPNGNIPSDKTASSIALLVDEAFVSFVLTTTTAEIGGGVVPCLPTMVDDAVVLAYLLECAIRRLALRVVRIKAQRVTKKLPQGGAVISVLLSDLGKMLISDYRHVRGDSLTKITTTTTTTTEDTGDDEDQRLLEDLHKHFIDPDGPNLRNLLMHGYFTPLRSSLSTHEDASLALQKHICHWLRQQLFSLARLAAGLSADLTNDLVLERLPLPIVGLEREPLRREAVEECLDRLSRCRCDDDDAAIHDNECQESAFGRKVIALFPVFEWCVRVHVASSLLLESVEEPPEAAVKFFVPQPHALFADLEQLMHHPLHQHHQHHHCDDEGQGKTHGDERWWICLDAICCAPDGPRFRDVLLHGKWMVSSQWSSISDQSFSQKDNSKTCMSAIAVLGCILRHAIRRLMPLPMMMTTLLLHDGNFSSTRTLSHAEEADDGELLVATLEASLTNGINSSPPLQGSNGSEVLRMSFETWFSPSLVYLRRVMQWCSLERRNVHDDNSQKERSSVRIHSVGLFTHEEEEEEGENDKEDKKETTSLSCLTEYFTKMTTKQWTEACVIANDETSGLSGVTTGFAEAHAALSLVIEFWTQFHLREGELAQLVATRKARQSQRRMLLLIQQVQHTLLNAHVAVLLRIGVLIASRRSTECRAVCRELSLLCAGQHVAALHKPLWQMWTSPVLLPRVDA